MHLFYAQAGRPLYNCESPCSTKITDDFIHDFVFETGPNTIHKFTTQATTPSIVYLMMSRKYLPTEIDVIVNGNLLVMENITTIFDSFLQVVKYNVYNQTLKPGERVEFIITSKNRTLRWKVRTGTKLNMSWQQWLYLPVDMFHFHGKYWSNLFYDWIFFAIPFSLAILYISSTFGYHRINTSMAIYAACAFVGTAFAKIYHIVLSSFRLDDASEVIFSILVSTLVIEILPIIFCFQHIFWHKSKPFIQGTFSMVLSIILLVVGSSYYIGTGFLFLASVFTILSKIFKTFTT
jgi:hypothetical protein